MKYIPFRTIIASALVLIFSAFSFAKDDNFVTVKGSDTMVNLMSNIAETYMTAHPDVSISVTGGGSGTGIAAIINKTTDICASSRAMKPEEIKLAEEKTVHPKEIIIGLDGLAIMLNPENKIDSLTLADLKRIYTGESKNWKDFGGPDKEITVLSRESNSGTYVYFQEHVLEKADFSPTALLMTSTAAIAQEIKNNPFAIGYGGVAYALSSKVKIPSIKKDAASPAVFPSDEAVFGGSYPISRPLFLYTNGDPLGTSKNFIDYCLSPEGQSIVTETGYIAIVHK